MMSKQGKWFLLAVVISSASAKPTTRDFHHLSDSHGGYTEVESNGRIFSPTITTKINVESQSFPIKVPVKVPVVKYVPKVETISTVKTIKVPVPVVKKVPVKVVKTVKVLVPVGVKSEHHHGFGLLQDDFLLHDSHAGDFVHGTELIRDDFDHGSELIGNDFDHHGSESIGGDFDHHGDHQRSGLIDDGFIHGISSVVGHSDFFDDLHGFGHGDLDITHAGDGFIGSIGH